MLRKIAALVLALALMGPGVAYAGAAGGSPVHATTTSTSTSTSSSTSSSQTSSTSYQTNTNNINEGQIWQTSIYSGNVSNYYAPYYGLADHPDVAYQAVVSNYVGVGSNFAEQVTANFGQPQNYMYWSSNGMSATEQGWGSLGSNPYWAYVDAANISTGGFIYGRGSIVSDSQNLSSQSNTAISLGSTSSTAVGTSQQVSQQISQQLSTQVSTQGSTLVLGDVVLGATTNTNTNTNVNTNTNTNVNTNYNYVTTVNNFSGYGTTSVYSVSAQVAISPIVLDLSGTGKLDASGGTWLPHRGIKGHKVALFDFFANNDPVMMEWVGPRAGLLVEPKADGTVDGSCLFGTTGGYDNGWEKLSLRDRNHDGKLTGSELKGLMVWVDSNGNGKVDKGELHTLQSLHITELSLDQHNMRGSFVMNGKTEAMWDWWPTAMIVHKMKVVVARR